jgi:aspartyl-tRNA(Asn)/glutamyl-tRNA(Gln) amidotransferase subunit B
LAQTIAGRFLSMSTLSCQQSFNLAPEELDKIQNIDNAQNDSESNLNQDWESIIGLEVHMQLATCAKLFSGAATAYGAQPNTQACGIDLGLPGTLPVLNGKAVWMSVLFGLSIDAHINLRSVFDRKNYFYPDLSKGYQITQFYIPIVSNGVLVIILDGAERSIGITRAHLEEDAGKSLHQGLENCTGVDYNRAGNPLLEIVSEPVLRSAKEAVAYLKTLHQLGLYLKICDGNLQEGSFRCDANVSVRRRGESKLGQRTEIKNLNSFRFVEKAIDYEITRHIRLLEAGQSIQQETRLYDSDKNETRSMRSKENAHDYRYFPDPDLCPVQLDEAFILAVKQSLPELPRQKFERFVRDYGLSAYDAELLVSTTELADYFEATVSKNVPAKLAANWINGELASALNEHNLNIANAPIAPERLAQLLNRITDHTISGTIAKNVFETLWKTADSVDHIIEKQGLRQITDLGEIEQLIDQVLVQYPQQLADFRSGKDKLLGFFVGQVMKLSRGRVNPERLNELIRLKLNGYRDTI